MLAQTWGACEGSVITPITVSKRWGHENLVLLQTTMCCLMCLQSEVSNLNRKDHRKLLVLAFQTLLKIECEN